MFIIKRAAGQPLLQALDLLQGPLPGDEGESERGGDGDNTANPPSLHPRDQREDHFSLQHPHRGAQQVLVENLIVCKVC